MISGAISRGAARRVVLNIGSGPAHPEKLHGAFRGVDFREVRLDVEPDVVPDLVGNVVNMRGLVADASVDAIWSSHNLEHLHAHEVPLALGEFARVLKGDGFALITCPDVEAVARFILDHGMDAIVYESQAGPVRPLDMLWGHGASIAAGHAPMAHHTGFTLQRLAKLVLEAGFAEVRMTSAHYSLWGVCLMPDGRVDAIAPLFAETAERSLFPELDAPHAGGGPAA